MFTTIITVASILATDHQTIYMRYINTGESRLLKCGSFIQCVQIQGRIILPDLLVICLMYYQYTLVSIGIEHVSVTAPLGSWHSI